MHIYIMLAQLRNVSAPNPVMVTLFELLRARGALITVGVAEDLLLDPGRLLGKYDLYILKSHSPLWLSVAAILHNEGSPLLNPYPACTLVQNKIIAAARLSAAGIPTPRSWVTGDLALLQALVAEHPLIMKPYVGGRGVGIQIIRSRDELAQVSAPTQPLLVQEYLHEPADELKLYVIGEQVFGIRKPRPGSGTARLPEVVDGEVRALALRCGAVFGLGLYGLDVILAADGPQVIDVNYFPSYKGIPEAPFLLADYIEDYLATGMRLISAGAAPDA